ncbi:putative Receptor protein kinase [Quillaja saponaria]|uniref:Receptor protein kinase n=1 Tax=Quillaja saponaria TaxID=32244 RepID=A0AAD7LLG1_QUISA|nr:putative Receptor protein kinase [Quillaja saponaria]
MESSEARKLQSRRWDVNALREFLHELKVLTHVYHGNVVYIFHNNVKEIFKVQLQAIDSSFSNNYILKWREPLPWSARLQIALDLAKVLGYIHELTMPAYIHRNIKPENILVDNNFSGKLAVFSLSRSGLLVTNTMLACKYAQYGDLSPKVDVYVFGVVLYELISAKAAVVTTNEAPDKSKSLVDLFGEVLNQPDPTEDLRKLVDYSYGVVCLADGPTRQRMYTLKSTTNVIMTSVVVALMTLSSSDLED